MSRTNHKPSLPRDEKRDLTQDTTPYPDRQYVPSHTANANDGEEYA